MNFDPGDPEIGAIIRRALDEDIGTGDVTSEACVPAGRGARGRFIARQDLVLAGVELLPLIYEMRGGVDELKLHCSTGDRVSEGAVIATVRGRARTLLECERVALNFMQRLSGVATLARKFAERVEGTNCRVLDTRKTTPGLRRLEKWAAAAGGIANHRMGLFDAILIKNNHIAAAGGVRPALEAAMAKGVPVQIEVRTRAELDEALAAGAPRVLLDNLTPAEAAGWVRYIGGRAVVELSGGITLDNVRAYAEAGADYVSSGAITHSAAAVDISFRLELEEHGGGVPGTGAARAGDAGRTGAPPDHGRGPDQGLAGGRTAAAAAAVSPERRAAEDSPVKEASLARQSGCGVRERTIVRLESCATTMFEAARLAASGAPHGSAVVANEQTAGQGRFGRVWHSERGAGLYVSIILRLPEAGLLTLALGLAVADAIEIPCDLRWPNDVLVNGRKIAGILVNRELDAFIAGIGINVNHSAFPPELAGIATSLRLATGREHDREALLGRLLEAVERRAAARDTLEAFAARSSWVRGKRVIVNQGAVVIEGITDGLDPAGYLYVKRPDGIRVTVLAGGVRPAE